MQKTVQVNFSFNGIHTLPFCIPIASLSLGEITRLMQNFGINHPIRFFNHPNRIPQDKCVGINIDSWDNVLRGRSTALYLSLHSNNESHGWLFLFRVFQDYLIRDKYHENHQGSDGSQQEHEQMYSKFFALDSKIIHTLQNICYELHGEANISGDNLHLSKMRTDEELMRAIETVLKKQQEKAKK